MTQEERDEQDLDSQGYKKEYPIFTVQTLDKIENAPGCWNSIEVGVFEQDSKDQVPFQIGKYVRNYSTNFNNFSYCRKGDRYFALYSPDYTSTRVLEITPGLGIKDIGGEERDGCGFCPIDLYIPTIREYVNEEFHTGNPKDKIKDWTRILDFFPPGARILQMDDARPGRQKLAYSDGKDIRAYNFDAPPDKYSKNPPYDWCWGPERMYQSGFVVHPPIHAFVAGCYWGDDSSYKIQYIDVSRIDEGIIKRDDRFGYIALPDTLTLDKAIQTEYLDESGRIKISIDIEFDVTTGAAFDFGDSFTEKLAIGAAKMKEDRNRWSGDSYQKFEQDLMDRWREQGEKLTAEILASGGRIGSSRR